MTLVGSTTTDQLDVSGLTGADGNPVNAWDVTVSNVGGNALLTFPNGTSILLNGVAPASVTTAPQLHSIGIPCFVAGTMIDTPSGPRAVETIRTGDEVLTAEGQPITVIWAGGKTFDAADLARCERLKPVVFRPNSTGNVKELRLSRQHRVVIDTTEGPRLVAAGGLAAARGSGARIAKGCRKVSYRHLLLTRHAIIRAEGALVESLWPGPLAAKSLGPETCREIAGSCPQLAPALAGKVPTELVFGPQALPMIRRGQLRSLSVNSCAALLT
ncbi:Hint domain-containing protein [Thioclava kandeliae]|uniref:Hint domain-containing protein n=1 Tax=Thioclava kandeliae TaxID=3070818 RepID=A0ABV1SMC4_9RHOB